MRYLAYSLCLATVLCSAGCTICPPGYLDDYATVGGKIQRSNPTHGRVGSILSDGTHVTDVHSMPGEEIYYAPGADYYPGSEYIEPSQNSLGVMTPLSSERQNSVVTPLDGVQAEKYSTAPGYADSLIRGDSRPAPTSTPGRTMSILE